MFRPFLRSRCLSDVDHPIFGHVYLIGTIEGFQKRPLLPFEGNITRTREVSATCVAKVQFLMLVTKVPSYGASNFGLSLSFVMASLRHAHITVNEVAHW